MFVHNTIEKILIEKTIGKKTKVGWDNRFSLDITKVKNA